MTSCAFINVSKYIGFQIILGFKMFRLIFTHQKHNFTWQEFCENADLIHGNSTYTRIHRWKATDPENDRCSYERGCEMNWCRTLGTTHSVLPLVLAIVLNP